MSWSVIFAFAVSTKIKIYDNMYVYTAKSKERGLYNEKTYS